MNGMLYVPPRSDISFPPPPLPPVNTSNKWTRALWEPTAGVQAHKPCVALGDLQGHQDFQLILVDEQTQQQGQGQSRLKLFRGLKPAVESILAEQPTGIVSFVCDVVGRRRGGGRK